MCIKEIGPEFSTYGNARAATSLVVHKAPEERDCTGVGLVIDSVDAVEYD